MSYKDKIAQFRAENESREKYLDIKGENAEFFLTNITIENEDTNLYKAMFIEPENEKSKENKFFCPTSLRTRLENLEVVDNPKCKSIVYIGYKGIKKSSKGRDMHSFFVKVL